MNKNLLEKLRKVTAEFTEAQHANPVDQDLCDALQDEIWNLEDEIAEDEELDYNDKHDNKTWY